MCDVLNIIKDPALTFNQRYAAMEKAAENSIDVIEVSETTRGFIDGGIVYDMREGNAPLCPRYVVPDYDLFMKRGSKFLMLDAPGDIWDAVSNLMILSRHVPSVTGMPVYAGHLDRLLEPFVDDKRQARRAIKTLLTYLDRTIPDSFCHCNIGPYDTAAGRIILDLTAEMQRPVPNMSLIYNEETPDDFAIKAIETGLIAAKPSFVNDRVYSRDWNGNYAVVSCYNVLPLGGGGYTLVRLNLKKIAERAGDEQEFMMLLNNAAIAQCELMDARIRFIVDECRFFEHSFLADEGLLHQDRFVGMFGLVGLAECVNTLIGAPGQFGRNPAADALGERILDRLCEIVEAYTPKYGRLYLHAQVGVSDDVGVTPGTRIPVGDEPELPKHLAVTARMQKNFPAGTGELFPFDETVKNNPQYVLDIIKGAFMMDMRYFSYYSCDSDVIRITGYLVKKSDMRKLQNGEAVLNNTTAFGIGAAKANNILNRKVRGLNIACQSADK